MRVGNGLGNESKWLASQLYMKAKIQTRKKTSDLFSHSSALSWSPPSPTDWSSMLQVALLCIMAQVGSFVPAASATLGVLDAVYTR